MHSTCSLLYDKEVSSEDLYKSGKGDSSILLKLANLLTNARLTKDGENYSGLWLIAYKRRAITQINMDVSYSVWKICDIG